MYNNPDWDPLKTLDEIIANAESQSNLLLDVTKAVNNHAGNINEMVKIINGLNTRICILENTIDELRIELDETIKNRS